MKKIVLIMLMSLSLSAFDWNLPPVQEEIMGEDSVSEDKVVDSTPKDDNPLGELMSPVTEDKRVIIDSTDVVTGDVVTIEEPMKSIPLPYIDRIKVALLVPQKVIGRYASSVSNSIISYLLFRDIDFQFEVFDSKTEDDGALLEELEKIKQKGYQLVIAPVTEKGASVIVANERELLVYIPTINKKDMFLKSQNIFFGGIDYEKQIEKLLEFAGEKIAIFSDKSRLAQKLDMYVESSSFSEIAFKREIADTKANLSYLFRRNYKLNNASIFLNLPLVATSLVASQLSLYHVNYQNILSTQINYSPLLLTLTQPKDRELIYIANSISETDMRLKDINLLFGNNISFSWIDYSSSIGIDYLLGSFTSLGINRITDEEIISNQVQYNVGIVLPQRSSFKKLDVVKKFDF